ncbi:hypothetical protein OH768_07315 [Streptomyces sp. NBC_01622]|uniref:hypothetical protein n=1 Tax=Streptomyces sp. NBC_01622 TaxID=2975903 RepID=UPI0038643985|nr:hypothetical protein OH768_07315 [Streptomyces sp. NBC_01622]
MGGVQQQRRVGIDAQAAHLEEVGLRLGTGGRRSERGRHATTVVDIAAAAGTPVLRHWAQRFTESMDQLRDRESRDTAMEIPGRWLWTQP